MTDRAVIKAALRFDARSATEAMQSLGHAFERMGSQMQTFFGVRPGPQRRAERAEKLSRRQAAERFAMLQRHGRNVQVVTGADGVSRVRVVA